MRNFISYVIFMLLISSITCACTDNIDIRQGYEFQITHLPVPKKLKVGEVVEIRCQLESSGHSDDTAYRFRYFQPDGKGELRMDSSKPFLPNDYYDLTKESFRFYYTSHSDEQQVIDIYFFDNFGNSCTLSFTFNNDNDEEKQL